MEAPPVKLIDRLSHNTEQLLSRLRDLRAENSQLKQASQAASEENKRLRERQRSAHERLAKLIKRLEELT